MLHRIQRIVNVTPYTIICEWTNGETRAIQMEQKLREWASEQGSVYERLLEKVIFMNVQLDTESKTLYWNGLVKMQDTSGNLIDAPLDIDPDVLYGMSVPFIGKINREGKAA